MSEPIKSQTYLTNEAEFMQYPLDLQKRVNLPANLADADLHFNFSFSVEDSPYYIGETRYEIEPGTPFSEWKNIILTRIPYHSKSTPAYEWTNEDYEEYCNRNLRLDIIYALEDLGTDNWTDESYQWAELARRGINLYGFRDDPLKMI